MRSFLILCALIGCSYGKVPEYLEHLICKASDPDYEKCVLNSYEAARPYLITGIPELGIPAMDPLELPLVTVNRTLNDVVSINAVCRNVRVEGGRNTIFESLKADPIKHTGEMRMTLPWAYMEMEYDVSGQLLAIPLQSKGFFRGNFTNTQFYVKCSLEKYKRDDEEYFKVKKIASKIVVGDGWIKLTSKNPDLQFGADIITNFFNENPRRVMDTINPIFIDTTNELIRVVSDQILFYFKKVTLSKENLGFLQVSEAKKLYVSLYELPFTQAYATCKRYGWKLATEQSFEESTALNTTLTALGYVNVDFWLGGYYQNDGQFNPIWLWLDSGKEVTYVNWNKGEPSAGSDTTDGLLKRSIHTFGGQWSSAPSTNKYRFICEIL